MPARDFSLESAVTSEQDKMVSPLPGRAASAQGDRGLPGLAWQGWGQTGGPRGVAGSHYD